ncbi:MULTISPECIES: hypothetical protein [Prevotellaceae]|jgi:hypothetical protein|uniref:hypothetical protein n=1 Tax=Prevotellaceae TaxID=171552 RepID=UPI000AAF616E|nr:MULTISPECIES: hypothetical protein [Prevotellaceae]MBF1499077.1 hypothetical protein [Prevotella pallens]
MTSREFVKRSMERIRELGKDMSNEDYSNSLEQLAYELETERQEVNWQVLTSEGKFI